MTVKDAVCHGVLALLRAGLKRRLRFDVHGDVIDLINVRSQRRGATRVLFTQM